MIVELASVDGEIAFFRSVMRARPVGIHRHFHVLAIRNAILQDTGQVVSTDDIWAKLRTCYDLDALEGLETDGYDSPGSSGSTPPSISTPSPSQNLSGHPFFREEFSLPSDDPFFEALVSSRRVRATASPPSASPTSSPPPAKARGRRGSKRRRSKLDLAGLVGGDSDSSALTQESGDEGVAPTPRSVVTVTDGGTDYAEDEDAEMRDHSPAPSASSKPVRNKSLKSLKKSAAVAGRTRAAAGSASRSLKKKKK